MESKPAALPPPPRATSAWKKLTLAALLLLLAGCPGYWLVESLILGRRARSGHDAIRPGMDLPSALRAAGEFWFAVASLDTPESSAGKTLKADLTPKSDGGYSISWTTPSSDPEAPKSRLDRCATLDEVVENFCREFSDLSRRLRLDFYYRGGGYTRYAFRVEFGPDRKVVRVSPFDSFD